MCALMGVLVRAVVFRQTASVRRRALLMELKGIKFFFTLTVRNAMRGPPCLMNLREDERKMRAISLMNFTTLLKAWPQEKSRITRG